MEQRWNRSINKPKLILLPAQQANKSRGKMLGSGKHLYLESQHMEERVGSCLEEPTPLAMKSKLLSCQEKGGRIGGLESKGD